MTKQVTDIQAQKKREGYYSVFLDEKYTFSLSELDLSTSGLKVGQILSQARLEELQKLSELSKIYSRAIYYLRYGPRTVRQMQQYLVRKVGFDEEDVLPVLQKLQDENYLGDAAYAQSYIYARQIGRPRSKRQLSGELRQKGVPSDIIDECLSSIDADDQKLAVNVILRKKIALSKFKDQQKLIEYMLRQGFTYSLVKEVLAEINSGAS